MPKFCPFAKSECLTEACACYIKAVKPVFISPGIIDPKSLHRYEGCGLVSAIIWQLIDRDIKKEKVCANDGTNTKETDT